MRGFFYPDSVAVIGVSPSPTNLGRAIVYHLVEFGYSGTIYLVGPKGGSFLGHRIYRSVHEIPAAVDLAAILTPAETLPDIIRACGEKGVRRLVIESAGFRELGEERRALEAEVMATARRFGIRFIGPNCIGVMNKENGLALPFVPFRDTFHLGPLSIVSQSGGVGGALLNTLAAEELGFSKFASIGNKLDTNENDLLEYLLEDESTRIIFLYLEGIADGRRLMELASRSTKPILVHKSNTSEASARIARSHTASLAASDEVVSAAFRQSAMHRVNDMRSAMDAIRACNLQPMRGNRLAVVSRSGGHAVVAADAAMRYGFHLQPFSETYLHMVENRLRAGVIRLGNPMDLGDLFDLDFFHQIVSDTLRRTDIDGVLMIHNYNGVFFEEGSRALVEAVRRTSEEVQKPVALCLITTEDELRANRRANPGFPLFSEPEEATRALALSRGFSGRRPSRVEESTRSIEDAEKVRALLGGARARNARHLALDEAFSVLSSSGVPVSPWAVARSAGEASARAADLRFPVALKVMSESFVHKSDVGGVLLNLGSVKEVEEGYERLASLVRATVPNAAEQPVLIQTMVARGLEIFVGGKQDPTFGPVVLVGLGGVYVEVLEDVALRVAPVTSREASGMLDEIRGRRLLEGVRGEPPADRERLVGVIQRISHLLYDLPEIQELDVNPLKVLSAGNGCVAVDCRIVLSPETAQDEDA
ncbi:MAG TPA: acetate--CoA ligase family protein [Syntrophobacteria bacterium]|nr:acetate--CoA ligase family protein [Syntrophobacteria bacterium]